MRIEKAKILLESLENDKYVQNLIAQSDSRYLLFNVQEPIENFPNYTANLDERLTSTALAYLSIGCTFAENGYNEQSIMPLEKGATILENVYSPTENRNEYSSYFIIAGSLSYYASKQYSKSFILLKDVQFDTVIGHLIISFLKRDYIELGNSITEVMLSEDFTDDAITNAPDETISNNKIYTLILTKGLSSLLEFIYTGSEEWLSKTREYIRDLLELLSIDSEPSLWWVIRLLQLIVDDFEKSSLWRIIPPYMDNGSNYLVNEYISAMAFQDKPVVELFVSQKKALPKVLDSTGTVVSLPTSSGKTRIAEIAIIKSLVEKPDSIVLYLAPFRSLAYEVEESLSSTFKSLGYEVSHLYGGGQFSRIDEMIIDESSVIIATPEKTKAILRTNSEIKSKIKLVIIDEGHLLGAEERYLMSEVFIEEIRYHIKMNEGKVILLSAVLPNSDEIAKWISGDGNQYVSSRWRPASQRFGLLEYNGSNVNITWKGEIESFNKNFIKPFKLKRKRSEYTFPRDKKQAIGAVALKLSLSGSVLVFVSRKNMVLSQAREIMYAMGESKEEHHWISENEWSSFKLACEEAYGKESEIYQIAKYGVLCHHSGLTSEVRLCVERLLRKGNPKIIIATSTLGQGVNIGVSSVIIANVWFDNEQRIQATDFWNIVGRAGRSFIDREGKILFVVDASKNTFKTRKDKQLALEYFDSSNQEKAISGLGYVINYIFRIASDLDMEFSYLLELIAENDFSQLKKRQENTLVLLFDLIDDTLLALNQEFESFNNKDSCFWIDEFFRESLAYIQACHFERYTEEDVLSVLKARNRGVLKLAGDKANWQGLITSSIPLRSGLHINNNLTNILEVVNQYQQSERSIHDLINFMKETENIVVHFPSKQFNESDLTLIDKVRNKWINGKVINEINDRDRISYNKYFDYILPWGINAIARMLYILDYEEESKEFEELAVLVQMGLPNMFACNIYLSGIYSRAAATELSLVLGDEFEGLSLKQLRNSLIGHIDKISVSDNTKQWIVMLKGLEKGAIRYIESIPTFTIKTGSTINGEILSLKKFHEEYYLCSPDFTDKIKINLEETLYLKKFANDAGVSFKLTKRGWRGAIRNPFIKKSITAYFE